MPEQQFVKALAKRKWEAVQNRKKAVYDQEYILNVTLPTSPPIFRKIRCHNSISLFKFTDTVLIPSMGWTRNLHTWIYEDPKDGSVIGHKDSRSIDHTQIPLLCWDILDDTDICLGDVLQERGDFLFWTYDLQHLWEHVVELEESLPCSDPSPPICLEGELRCPPEESRGLRFRGISGYQREITETFQKGQPFRHKNPVNLLEVNWDWKFFDVKATNTALQHAVNSAPSVGSATRKSIFLDRFSSHPSKLKNGMPHDAEVSSDLEMIHEVKRDEDRACVVCKKVENTKKCSRCQQCFYCSRDCQRFYFWNLFFLFQNLVLYSKFFDFLFFQKTKGKIGLLTKRTANKNSSVFLKIQHRWI